VASGVNPTAGVFLCRESATETKPPFLIFSGKVRVKSEGVRPLSAMSNHRLWQTLAGASAFWHAERNEDHLLRRNPQKEQNPAYFPSFLTKIYLGG